MLCHKISKHFHVTRHFSQRAKCKIQDILMILENLSEKKKKNEILSRQLLLNCLSISFVILLPQFGLWLHFKIENDFNAQFAK